MKGKCAQDAKFVEVLEKVLLMKIIIFGAIGSVKHQIQFLLIIRHLNHL